MHEMSGTQLSLSFFIECLAHTWSRDVDPNADISGFLKAVDKNRAAIIDEDICVNPE